MKQLTCWSLVRSLPYQFVFSLNCPSAGNYGSGKRGGGVSTLICAVFDDRKTYEDDEDPKYNTFVRIGSGLSFADYVWVRDKPWKVWDPKHPPEFLQVASRGQDDKGDVYLKPEE